MKNIIFNDSLYDYMQDNKERINEYLKDNDLDLTPNNQENAAQELINIDIDDLKSAIKYFDTKIKYDSILVIGSLGLWYGRREGFKHYDNLESALFSLTQDINIIYYTRRNAAIILNAIHHDGTNIFKFYKIVNGKKRAITFRELYQNYYNI